MVRSVAVVLACIVGSAVFSLWAEETPTISPAKAAQLRRLEPLTSDKIDVFVEGGQLTEAQAAYVKKHIGPNGQLALPEDAIGPEKKRETPRSQPQLQPQDTVRREAPTVQQGPYADFKYQFNGDERPRLTAEIREFRHGNRSEIGRVLRQARPQVNELIAAAYTDSIDLPVKIALWEEVAGPVDPDATFGLFETHRLAYDVARPVLIPYAKDVGGVLVRRSVRSADPGAVPLQRFFTSRELRDMILDIEGLIARCSGPSAAIFLMGVYSQRYEDGDAPMRDDGRDWRRLVEACGGSPKKFDDDKPETWGSRLSVRQRAAIAERLIPWLSRKSDDRRKIARNALMVCLPHGHPDWEAGRGEWDRWWEANKDGLLNAQ